MTLAEQLTPELLEAARRAFADVLNIPVDLVHVAYLREGSVVLLVQMPEDVANRLIVLHESGKMRLPDLNIKQIKPIENLIGANLQGVNLKGFGLFEANLRGADLSEADLSWAYLNEADLSEANLSRANLSGADLSGADLSWTNLSGANLGEANLSRADLSGADLSETDLTTTNLADVISDEQTKWPWQHDYEKVKILK